MSRRLAALCLVLATVVACSPSPGPLSGGGGSPGATEGGGGTGGTQGPGSTDGGNGGNGGNGGSLTAQPGVIQGRVTTEAGAPIAGARIRLIGYTESIGQHDDNLVTGSDGVYRAEVPDGLYELSGELTLPFEGQDFILPIEPVDLACDEMLSAPGIVEDFVLRLDGLRGCLVDPDPDNADSYFGAVVYISPSFSAAWSPDAVVEFTLNPTGPLADGSTGSPLSYERRVADLTSYLGPVESTGTLHDVPLGRYTVSATIRDGSTEVPLMIQSETDSVAARETTLTFTAAQFFPYGIRDQTLTITDDGLG
jgi:hypothetical protein